MKLLILKSVSLGGISTHISELKRGFDIYGIEVVIFECSFTPRGFFNNIVSIINIIRVQKPDVIHIHGYKAMLFSFLLPGKISKVCTVHGFLEDLKSVKGKTIKWLLAKCMNRIDVIICVSNHLQKHVVNVFNVHKEKIRVIYNGVSIPESKIDKKRGARIFGACGRLTKAKGYHLLIEAFNKISPSHGAELHIIGDGPDMELLKSLSGPKVNFHGYKDNPQELLLNYDVFIQLSLYEGCGISVLEAMSLNLPVIVSDAGGLPELIENGEHGLVFPKGDISALTNCISMVLSNKELYSSLGNENRTWVAKHFNYTKMLEKTINIYKELMGEEVYEQIL